MKLLLSLIVLALSSAGFATEASTALNYSATQSGQAWMNNASQITLSATEQNVVITVAPGYPVTVQLAPPGTGQNSWTYSTTTGDATKTTTVVSGQNVVLKFASTTTLYLKSAGGVTLSISCLDYQIRDQ